MKPTWYGINQPIVKPDGSIVDSGISLEDYERRVQAYEDQDICRSDAQGIVDAELLRKVQKMSHKQAYGRREVVERLNALTDDDQEQSHEEADMLICDAMILKGMFDVVEAYLAAKKRVGFHYA